MTQTPDTDQILSALTAAGLTITGHQIEADSIDIHLDHTYAGFHTDYRAVALGWRPVGPLGQTPEGRWYLMPLDPKDESAPAPTPDYLNTWEPAAIVDEVLEMFEYSDEWMDFVAARRAAVGRESAAKQGRRDTCPDCGNVTEPNGKTHDGRWSYLCPRHGDPVEWTAHSPADTSGLPVRPDRSRYVSPVGGMALLGPELDAMRSDAAYYLSKRND